MGQTALTAQRAATEPPPPGRDARIGRIHTRRRRLITPCQGDRDYIRAVEHLIAEGAQARSLGAKGFR